MNENECDFCTQGVRPFYALEAVARDGKKTICHTCHALGKHRVVADAARRDLPSPGLALAPGSGTTKK